MGDQDGGEGAERLLNHLTALYPADRAQETLREILSLLDQFQPPDHLSAAPRGPLDARDCILITYADQVQEPGRAPIDALYDLLVRQTADFLTGVHLLPFFPYTSDDGFSVVDYHAVDPEVGDWEGIERIAARFRLMADAVVNHISASSHWFRGYLAGEEPYTDFFIEVEPGTDLSQVVRPRTLPLLTRFVGARGERELWTTFSADQIDLNFATPAVLVAVTKVLLDYVARGAQLIRLDAIAFLWKEAGTTCLHLPQTHEVVRFWRTVLDQVAPYVQIITETNVPHSENISYFGNGRDEAQMVYQFSLPPLTLHTFRAGDATVLKEWARTLETPSAQTTFFNFLASHDGIGVRPAEGLLTPAQIGALVSGAEAHGGQVSYRTHPDGSRSAYELNINYYDALNDPAAAETDATRVSRFVAAHAILLALAGVPALYVHSLFGSRGWPEGVKQTGRARTINRQKFDRAALEAELGRPDSRRRAIFDRLAALIRARASRRAFDPTSPQQVLPSPSSVFAILRGNAENGSLVCLTNVTGMTASVTIAAGDLPPSLSGPLEDLLGAGGIERAAGEDLELTLAPYESRWLAAERGR